MTLPRGLRLHRLEAPDRSMVSDVKGWLTTENDALLDKYRPGLEKWSAAASAALENETALKGVRAEYWTARETLASKLTTWRDKLHAALVQPGIERGLRRDWPDPFFKTIYTSTDSEADAVPPETEPVQ